MNGIVKQIILPTFVLTLVAALVAGLLSFTYVATGIADIDTGLTAEALAELQPQVLPEGGTLTAIETDVVLESELASLIAVFGDGETGIALHVACVGYSGKSKPIEALVGIDKNGTVTGVTVLATQETPGLGTKIEDPEYLANYVGVTNPSEEVDTITAATYSSGGLRNGVDYALQIFNEIKGEVF